MSSCSLRGAAYNMTVEILELNNHPERNAYGEVVKTGDKWVTDRTITCVARAAKGTGVRFTPSREQFGQDYMDYEYVMLNTTELVSKRARVTNIKDANGNIAWVDEDGSPTVFNVNGHIPQFDPWGTVVEYIIVLERVDAQ